MFETRVLGQKVSNLVYLSFCLLVVIYVGVLYTLFSSGEFVGSEREETRQSVFKTATLQ